MKASEQYFPMVLFIVPNKVVLTLEVLRTLVKSLSVTTEMEITEQYFPVVLLIMLYKVALSFESVDEILKCDYSNESYWAVLFCSTVYYAAQSGWNFWVCNKIPTILV